MTKYLTEHTMVHDTHIYMIYPETVTDLSALVGVPKPDVSADYPFKVRVYRTEDQTRWTVEFFERNEDLETYSKRETYRRYGWERAIRKAESLICRGINMGGVF